MEIASWYYTSRTLHVAAKGRIADVIADADLGEGVHISEIASKTGVEHRKLGGVVSIIVHCTTDAPIARIMRALCSIHVFNEVKELYFANTRTSHMSGSRRQPTPG